MTLGVNAESQMYNSTTPSDGQTLYPSLLYSVMICDHMCNDMRFQPHLMVRHCALPPVQCNDMQFQPLAVSGHLMVRCINYQSDHIPGL